jgi:hypothetical protein
MDSKRKREEITALIDNIKDHSDRLAHRPVMPLLEISAILSKINKLHESTVVLKYMIAKEQQHEDDEFGTSMPASFRKYKEVEEDDDFSEKEIPERQQSKPKVKPDSVQEEPSVSQSTQEDTVQVERKHSQAEEKKAEKESRTEEIDKQVEQIEKEVEQSGKPDLNEHFSAERNQSLSDQLKKQPVTDLFTAIGLNERYLYANELFGGDIEEFRKVVRVLNDQDDWDRARQYFDQELRSSYGWDEENKLAEALYLLVERRFNH